MAYSGLMKRGTSGGKKPAPKRIRLSGGTFVFFVIRIIQESVRGDVPV
jgi:hypothetical protein